jgi:hypothetical protein
MNMELVDSSSVTRVGHDEATQDLTVEFTGGRKYVYADVPETVYENLLTAKSVGKFVNDKIKSKYLFTAL